MNVVSKHGFRSHLALYVEVVECKPCVHRSTRTVELPKRGRDRIAQGWEKRGPSRRRMCGRRRMARLAVPRDLQLGKTVDGPSRTGSLGWRERGRGPLGGRELRWGLLCLQVLELYDVVDSVGMVSDDKRVVGVD